MAKRVHITTRGKVAAKITIAALVVAVACSAAFTNCFRSFWWNMEEKPAIEAPIETPDNGTEDGGETPDGGEENGGDQIGEPTDPGAEDQYDNGAEDVSNYDVYGGGAA